MIQPLADILDRCELFASVDRSALAAELASADIKALGAGEVLLDPLRQNDVVYILLDGQLLVCLEPKPGNPLVTLKPGDCVGELSIIDTRPPSAYVVAAAPCRLLAITRELMWRMVAGQPAVGANLLRILADRIRQNNAIILSSLELQRHYRNKAEYDALTGLRNRAWLDEIFPKQLELCERIGQRVSLVILDIDHFKRVNDTWGHAAGDQALRHLGALLRQHLRSTDLSARYGGEEVVILMPATEAPLAVHTTQRLREILAAAPVPLADGKRISLTFSAGVAEWFPGMSLDALFSAADAAMYRAKQAGRDRVEISTLSGALAAAADRR